MGGNYTDNQRDGLGKMTFADGGMYHGHFSGGSRNGEGTFIYPNKDVYSGSWKDGKKHGDGFYVFNTSKYYYKGTWSQGQISSGQWILSPAMCYEGPFKQQKPDGEGRFKFDGFEVLGNYRQQTTPLDVGLDDAANPPAEVRIHWQTTGIIEAAA